MWKFTLSYASSRPSYACQRWNKDEWGWDNEALCYRLYRLIDVWLMSGTGAKRGPQVQGCSGYLVVYAYVFSVSITVASMFRHLLLRLHVYLCNFNILQHLCNVLFWQVLKWAIDRDNAMRLYLSGIQSVIKSISLQSVFQMFCWFSSWNIIILNP